MSDFSPSAALGSPRWVAASVLSSILHLTAVVLIVAAIDRPAAGRGRFRQQRDRHRARATMPVNRRQPRSTSPNRRPPLRRSTAAEFAPPVTPVAAAGPAESLRRSTHRVRHASPKRRRRPASDAATTARPATGRRASACSASKAKARKFVYVFDRSTSMEGAPLAAAKQQLIESLQSLDSVHQFHIIFFNHADAERSTSRGGGRRIAFATDRNKKLAAQVRRRHHGRRRHRPAAGAPRRDATAPRRDLLSDRRRRPDAARASWPRSPSSIAAPARRSATIEFGRGPAKAAEELPHRARANHRRAVRLRRHDEAVAVTPTEPRAQAEPWQCSSQPHPRWLEFHVALPRPADVVHAELRRVARPDRASGGTAPPNAP